MFQSRPNSAEATESSAVEATANNERITEGLRLDARNSDKTPAMQCYEY